MGGMSVLVCFHAHPDDEVFTTGGIIRRAADEGHRVVLVTATDGALGEVPEGILRDGESLAERRRSELEASAALLGAQRVVFLPYADSGMAGTASNSASAAFCNADPDEAARRLADVLHEESADVVTVYDPNGGYGHPDHIQVHHVGVRAAGLAGVDAVYEAAVNRDHVRRLITLRPSGPEDAQIPDLDTFGLPESELTTFVDVRGAIEAKRAAMHAHRTQIGDFGPFLNLSDDELRAAFGQEWFRLRGAPAGYRETALPL
ncbi:N-acetylglucosaminyl deacetylase, LmbE family [Rhodococcus triatomae]|uniref:N-acetylglucosaminyl deacetylase, LmbE family n=2 Tax=Rhodococcus triatomae TaxID=300028 RepID=A0A1G8J2H3_9NOCA|nr:N-acetylglucosaminyl deacetylase, LmbE family [Rhodococcus triatomae]